MGPCKMCENIIANLFSWDQKQDHNRFNYRSNWYYHHPSLLALDASAMQGCGSCLVLNSQISTLSPVPRSDELYYDLQKISRYLGPSKDPSNPGEITQQKKHSFTRMIFRTRKTHQERLFDIEISEERHFVSTSMMSDLRFAQIQSWMSQCGAEHTVCHVRYDAGFKPTRLIDVGQRGIAPRLIETKNSALQDSRYLALSHCWGLSMPEHATTRSTTLRNRLAKIPLKALPKTFSDAIKVTRKLGLRYIWIDSLCILQDSVEDWQRESALMGKVYSNCLCTIAAAESKDSHGGLIQLPEVYAMLRSWSKDDSDTGILLKPSVPPWEEVLEASPLNQRGWTLQERELSPRILYFTKDAMHFECREARGIGNLSLWWQYDDYKLKPKGNWERKSTLRRCMDPIYARNGGVEWLESSSLVPQKRYDRWLEMVQGYSGRKLSVENDIFPAISGLASEYAYLLKDRYVAGLWIGDLIRGLCWRSPEATSRLPGFVTKNYGPSWSWAGRSGPVSYDLLIDHEGRENLQPIGLMRTEKFQPIDLSPGCEDLPRVLEVRVKPAGADPNGSLTAAFMRLEGRIAAIKSRKSNKGNKGWYVGNREFEIIWDIRPNETRTYHMLSLGKVGLGLIITPSETNKEFYQRVGITRLPEEGSGWASGLMIDEIILI